MKDELPIFKYHLEPLKTGMIIEEKTFCPVCHIERDYKYVGPFYSEEEAEGICPWCIKDGSAAKKFNGQFHDSSSIELEIENAFLEELLFRTPGYSGLQQELWLVHCNEPCSFIDYVGWKEISDKIDLLAVDIKEQAGSYGLSIEKFSKKLVNGGYIQGYLFKCVKCGEFRLTTDCE